MFALRAVTRYLITIEHNVLCPKGLLLPWETNYFSFFPKTLRPTDWNIMCVCVCKKGSKRAIFSYFRVIILFIHLLFFRLKIGLILLFLENFDLLLPRGETPLPSLYFYSRFVLKNIQSSLYCICFGIYLALSLVIYNWLPTWYTACCSVATVYGVFVSK